MTEVTKDTEYKSLMNACCAPNLRANLNSSRSRPCSSGIALVTLHTALGRNVSDYVWLPLITQDLWLSH